MQLWSTQVLTPEGSPQPSRILKSSWICWISSYTFKNASGSDFKCILKFHRLCLAPSVTLLQYSQVTARMRRVNCSEGTAPGHRNTIPMLRSLDTEIVSACGKISVSCWLWFQFKHVTFWCLELFCFKKPSLSHTQILVLQTIVSFHKGSQTRRQLWEGADKVIFVMLLKKISLRIMWKAQTEEISEKSALSFTVLCAFTKPDVSFFKLMALFRSSL